MTQIFFDAMSVLKTSVGAGATVLAFAYLAGWLLAWHAKHKAAL